MAEQETMPPQTQAHQPGREAEMQPRPEYAAALPRLPTSSPARWR